jgi:hypothetical protein
MDNLIKKHEVDILKKLRIIRGSATLEMLGKA